MDDRYSSCVVTAAVTGGDVLPSQSQYIPRGAQAIANSAIDAWRAGAAIAHIHARLDDGRPSASGALFKEITQRIRGESDVVINVTTGGAPGMSVDERLEGLVATHPDMATLDLGTMNYEGYPTPSRWPKVATEWESDIVKASSGNGIFVNTLSTLRRIAGAIYEVNAEPELEAFDLGQIQMAKFLIDEGTLKPPVKLQLVVGVLGGAANTIEDVYLLYERAKAILGKHLADIGIAATGYPMQLRNAAVAMALGANVRVGLEDNIRRRRGMLAHSTAELVEDIKVMAEIMGRPIRSAHEVREQLRQQKERRKMELSPAVRAGC